MKYFFSFIFFDLRDFYRKHLKFWLVLAITFSFLLGCTSSLPANYSDIEKQALSDLDNKNYTARSKGEREAILTQDLFTQTTFWLKEYEINPADLEASYNLIRSLRRIGNVKKALEITQTSRALYPRNVDLLAEKAACEIILNQPREALRTLDGAIGFDTQESRLWRLRGVVYDQLQEYERARKNYARALDLTPNDPKIMGNIGLSHALAGDPRTGEVWLRRAATHPEATKTVRQNLSMVLGLRGKFEESRQWALKDSSDVVAKRSVDYYRSLQSETTPN